MRSKISILVGFIIVLSPILLSSSFVLGDSYTASSHDIVISKRDNVYRVHEIILLYGENLENISCWIPDDADEILISINDQNVAYTPSGNRYLLNLSGFNLSGSQTRISISYILPSTTEKFVKEFIRQTENFSLMLNGVYIIRKGSFPIDASINILLPHSEAAAISWYVAALLLLLLVLLVVVIVYALHRQKMFSVKEKAWKSEDVLETEKGLLFDMLKEIEKRYRDKKISDDTYHKLKSYYKQRTVEIMKDLDDLKS